MYKIFITVSISLFSFYSVPGFAAKNMALLEFKKNAIPAAEVTLIRNTLESVLVKSTDIPIVDREKMGKILKEQEIQLTGLTLSENAVKVGQLLNVHYLMSGDLSKVKGIYYLTLKVVSVENARTLGSLQVSGKTIPELIKEIEDKVSSEFNGLATLEIFYPQPDAAEKDKEIDVQINKVSNSPQFIINIKEPDADAEIYFDISKIDITYFSKIRIKFDKLLPVKVELGLSDSNDKESETVELNKLNQIGDNTYEIKISDLGIDYDSEWSGLSFIFPDKVENIKFVIRELVILP